MKIGPFEIRRVRTSPLRANPSGSTEGTLTYRCNICGNSQKVTVDRLTREHPSCDDCGSNVRFRSVVDIILSRYFGTSSILAHTPQAKEVLGLGLSDWEGYASGLDNVFSYTNTHFHKKPQVDVCCPPTPLVGMHDFVSSSDVFEHVLPPVQRAFNGAYSVLKPGGFLVFTVPFVPGASTLEHYPDAKEYFVQKNGAVLIRREDGTSYLDENPIFHGGPGATLEMRRFGSKDLVTHLEIAGFRDIRFHSEPNLEFGIVHESQSSIPISATRPIETAS